MLRFLNTNNETPVENITKQNMIKCQRKKELTDWMCEHIKAVVMNLFFFNCHSKDETLSGN